MEMDEWIKKYEKKAKEKFEAVEGFKLFYLPERGFCQIRVEKNMVIVRQVCGDGHFWFDFSALMAKLCGCKSVGTFYNRGNAAAYIKLWGYAIERVESLPDGLKQYHCVSPDGSQALVSPYGTRQDGTIIYMATMEV